MQISKAAATYVFRGHIARVCEKRRLNTLTVKEELLEESSSCIRLSKIRMPCPRQKSLFLERSA